MKRKRLGILLAVLGLLVAIGTGVYVYLQAEETSKVAQQITTTDVVVAQVELAARAAIPAAAVAVVKMPVSLVPPDAAKNVANVIGKYPAVKIYKGEPIIMAKLADNEGKMSPAYSLQEGTVAISYAGSDLLNGTGAIRPGDRVDMLISLPMPKAAPSGSSSGLGASRSDQSDASIPIVTQTMLQNLPVLRVGNFPSAGQQDSGAAGKTITFQVSHQDALILKWAKDAGGTIDLALRHPADLEPVSTDPVNSTYIFKKFKFDVVIP